MFWMRVSGVGGIIVLAWFGANTNNLHPVHASWRPADLTVREVLQLHAAVKGQGRQTAAESARQAAAEVGLADKLESLAGELSGGQRRKLSVAAAFLGQPRLVVLDEPTSGIDVYSRRFIWDILRRK